MSKDPTINLDQEISLLDEYVRDLTKIIYLGRGLGFLEEQKRKAEAVGISIPLIEGLKVEELKREDVRSLMEKASALAPEAQKIWESYRDELGLGNYAEFLHPIHLFASELIKKGNTPVIHCNDLIRRLKGLKYKKERELKIAQSPPPPEPAEGTGKETLRLDKESYTAKEIAGLLRISSKTFYTLPIKLKDFPEPVDPQARVNRRWSKEAVEKIYTAYKQYKKNNPRTPPLKSASSTKPQKRRKHSKKKVRK